MEMHPTHGETMALVAMVRDTLHGQLDAVLERVDRQKDGMNLQQKCEAYDALYLLRAALDDANKKAGKLKEHFDKTVVPEALSETETAKLSLDSVGYTFSVSNKLSCSLVDHGDAGKDPSMEYLKEVGLGDLIKPSVNAQSLASSVKEMMEEQGKEPDPAYVKVNPYQATNRTKHRSKS